MKSLRLIPVKPSRLVGAKLVLTAFMSVPLDAFLFIITFSAEATLHFSLLKSAAAMNFLKIYFLQGICLFFAMSPIIAIVAVLKKRIYRADHKTENHVCGFFDPPQGRRESTHTISCLHSAR